MTTEEKTTQEKNTTPAAETGAAKEAEKGQATKDASVPQPSAGTKKTPASAEASTGKPTSGGGERRPPRRRSGARGSGRRRGIGRERSEFDQKTIDVRRVARVVSGGRRFSFRVTAVIGDRNGRVGVGMGKGNDTASAIEKAARDGKKNMITVPRTESNSIPHQVDVKYKSVRLMVTPSPGKGIIAGSAARTVLELAGIKDVNLKIFSPTKNKLNIARATVYALSQLRRPRKSKAKAANSENNKGEQK